MDARDVVPDTTSATLPNGTGENGDADAIFYIDAHAATRTSAYTLDRTAS